MVSVGMMGAKLLTSKWMVSSGIGTVCIGGCMQYTDAREVQESERRSPQYVCTLYLVHGLVVLRPGAKRLQLAVTRELWPDGYDYKGFTLQPSVYCTTAVSLIYNNNNVVSIMQWPLALAALHHEEGHPVFVSIHLAVRSMDALL
jgi:hypothetical protein